MIIPSHNIPSLIRENLSLHTPVIMAIIVNHLSPIRNVAIRAKHNAFMILYYNVSIPTRFDRRILGPKSLHLYHHRSISIPFDRIIVRTHHQIAHS